MSHRDDRAGLGSGHDSGLQIQEGPSYKRGGKLSRGQIRTLGGSSKEGDFGSKSGNEPGEVVSSSLL